jgi:hypothetical protein
MKLRAYIIWTLLAVAAGPVMAASTVDTNTPVPSIFIMPTSPSEGRDPFFPNSTRPYEDSIVKHHTAVDITSLQIKGFSVIAGHHYVIINNHTFGEGDEGDVLTSDGRIHIRCLSIGADSVLVESGGAQHILKFSGQ